MKLLLINPHETAQGGYVPPPLGLAYLASVTRDLCEVRIIDGNLDGLEGIKKEINTFDPDILGITLYTPGRHKALEIAAYAKGLNKKIIFGGPHTTIMWKQLLNHYSSIDICVLGEGEKVLKNIIKDKPLNSIKGIAYKNNGNIIRNCHEELVPINEIPYPAWDLIDLNRYPGRPFPGLSSYNEVSLSLPRIPIIFSRGCNGKCIFCSSWWIWKKYRNRNAQNVMGEIELLNKYGVKHFAFQDDTMTINMDEIKEMCKLIIVKKLKIAYFATTKVDCVDLEMLKLMRESGCYGISFGIESGSQRILDILKKGIKVEDNRRAILLAKEAGLKVSALIIKNVIGEDNKSINETRRFLEETKPDDVGTIGNLWILPGTKLYNIEKKAGRINDGFWLGTNEIATYKK